MRFPVWPRMGAALAALILASGCASVTSSGTPSSPTTSSLPASAVVRVSEPAQGKTVQVHQGDHLVLTLHNTYWRIAAPVGGVLAPVGTQADSPSPDGSCLPGVGCGTVRAEFVASAVGTAELTASRTTCGEAMGCPPGQGHFEVEVVVS